MHYKHNLQSNMKQKTKKKPTTQRKESYKHIINKKQARRKTKLHLSKMNKIDKCLRKKRRKWTKPVLKKLHSRIRKMYMHRINWDVPQ